MTNVPSVVNKVVFITHFVAHCCYFIFQSPSLLKMILSQFPVNSCISTIRRRAISLLVPNSVEFYYPYWSFCYFGSLPISFTPQHNSPVTLKGHFTVPDYSVTLTVIDFLEYPFKQQEVLSQLKEMYFWQATIKVLTLKCYVGFYLSPGKLCSVDQV